MTSTALIIMMLPSLLTDTMREAKEMTDAEEGDDGIIFRMDLMNLGEVRMMQSGTRPLSSRSTPCLAADSAAAASFVKVGVISIGNSLLLSAVLHVTLVVARHRMIELDERNLVAVLVEHEASEVHRGPELVVRLLDDGWPGGVNIALGTLGMNVAIERPLSQASVHAIVNTFISATGITISPKSNSVSHD